MSVNCYVNENIKNTLRIFPEEERGGYLRLDMNENPEGLPLELVERVKEKITPETLSTYPETGRFTKKYADYLGVAPEQICLTSGSDTAIRYCMQTFVKPGDKVLTVTPTFEMYRIYCELLGYRHVTVPFNEAFELDGKEIVNAIDDETDMVVLLNPNNPIGRSFTEEEFRSILAKAAECGALVMVDEAYHYFYKNSVLPLVKEYENLLVLRTFSKLFSMAGCRMGAVISTPELAGLVSHLRSSFEVNSLALLFGEALMDEPSVIEQLMASEKEGRAYLLARLSENGYEFRNQDGNFVFIRPKTDAISLAERLKARKILVKTYGNPLLKPYLRLTTGSVKAMETFLNAFFEEDHAIS